MSAAVPITWDGNVSPNQFCANSLVVNGARVANIQYGYPVQFQCVDSAGTVLLMSYGGVNRKVFNAKAFCPDGYYADFSNQICVDSGTGAPFDYTYAAGIWSLAFTMVVGLFVISRYAGEILNLIRRG